MEEKVLLRKSRKVSLRRLCGFFFCLLLLQEFEEGSKEGRKDGNKSVFEPRVVMFVR